MQPHSDWRPHALDGALLWFHRRTGTNLRIDGPHTRHLRRRAPRLVLFGITNACNLACTFCSRDREARSEWTVDSAFDVLAGLARAGSLEVAFGGGEPLAFRGFDTLVQRLATETPLAVHFTTNGTLLTEERLARLAPHLGEVRVSLYDDNDWEACVERLARAGQTFGVNILATPERVPLLPAQLQRLHQLGCRDAAVLRYVGNDPKLRLDTTNEARLTEVLAGSPLRTRLSVCFGDTLTEVPRLFGGDCGAGLDFVTLTSDKRLKACSFQGSGLPITSAEDVLAAWTGRREVLSAPSPLQGCARAVTQKTETLSDGVRVWRGFSGNNSGDCVMVGRFETSEEATAYVEALLPDWKPGAAYPERWKELLAAEGIPAREGEWAPEAIESVGRMVLLHTQTTLGDDFPSLRKLLWKQKGWEVHSEVFSNHQLQLAFGFRAKEGASPGALEEALKRRESASFVRHGNQLYGLIYFRCAEQLKTLAREHGADLAAEVVRTQDDERLERLLAFRKPSAERPRLWARFPLPEYATRYARDLRGEVTVAGKHVLFEAGHFGPRLGYLAYRHAGSALVLTSQRVVVAGSFSKTGFQPPEVVPHLRPYLKSDDRLETTEWGPSFEVAINTVEPGRVLKAFVDLEKLLGTDAWIRVLPDNPLAEALHRIREELEADARRR
ncbi:radical SAM protein [Pyxidicoccus fallax]|uniref:Radical SAM protein n=1 Tax=Pyxidicoccus fallax TaxID=394095 RepID=A0A848L4U1_9BACT|nr:radical SAM protein [Pyxidicoccus fallax]NMO13477.1 radical SAM protein [Pyxidicoccus fallax]NPC78485.1 radical SAM protein [Pyxidicoccus fallax]